MACKRTGVQMPSAPHPEKSQVIPPGASLISAAATGGPCAVCPFPSANYQQPSPRAVQASVDRKDSGWPAIDGAEPATKGQVPASRKPAGTTGPGDPLGGADRRPCSQLNVPHRGLCGRPSYETPEQLLAGFERLSERRPTLRQPLR